MASDDLSDRNSITTLDDRESSELVWTNLHLAIKVPKQGYQIILDGVDGRCRPGEMTAILGSSGAGKTSLLNCLAGRLPKNGVAWGDVKVNAQERGKKTWPFVIGYVEQFELFFNYLTVRETIMLAVNLKMKTKGINYADTELLRAAKLQEVVTQLGLNFCVDRKINEISGGERKRVSIAVELVAEPAILFLDEPTSGLDAFTAFTTIQLLKNIAQESKKTVLLTIHQPRFDILELFDKVILMAKGKVVFSGRVHDSIKYFQNFRYDIPPNTNPSDFFLDLITLDTRADDRLKESRNRVIFLQKRWEERREETPDFDKPPIVAPVIVRRAKRSFFVEFGYLMKRNLKELIRNKRYLQILVIQMIVLIVLLGLVFLQLDYTQEAIQSRAGVVFFMAINAAFITMSPFLNVFPAEKQVIIRERRSKAYSGTSAFFAKVFSSIPQTIIYFLIFSSSLYWIIGLNPNAGRFFIFLLINISLGIFAIMYGLMIGAIAPNQQIAQAIGPTTMLVFVIFGGNFSNPDTIPAYVRWIMWLSPINYAYRAAVQNEFDGETFSCDSPQQRCLRTGAEVLDSLNLDYPGKWTCIIILWCLTVVVAIAGTIFLELATRTKYKLKLDKVRPENITDDNIILPIEMRPDEDEDTTLPDDEKSRSSPTIENVESPDQK